MRMRIASADTAVMSEYVEWLGQVRGRAPLTLKSYEAALGPWGGCRPTARTSARSTARAAPHVGWARRPTTSTPSAWPAKP